MHIFSFSVSTFILVLLSVPMPGCVPEDEAYIPTYLEAFPPLPEKGAPGEKAGEAASVWGSKIRPIKASVITQVRQPLTEHIDTVHAQDVARERTHYTKREVCMVSARFLICKLL